MGVIKMKTKSSKKLQTTAASQRQRIIKRLKSGPATTIQLRKEEDILMPAARIYDLRHGFGLNIQMYWVNQATDVGVMHRVGKYVLKRGKYKAGGKRK